MFIANVVFWGPQRGGRNTPPHSGFPPHIRAGDTFTSCIVRAVDKDVEVFEFDRAYTVSLELMFPEEYADRFLEGDTVALFEGSKKIAEGVLLVIQGQTTN